MPMTARDAPPDAFLRLIPEIEDDLAGRIDAAKLPENLRAAVRYSALGPGKRLRPALVVLCCEAAGGTRESARAAASAIELVHCFSLVHDDLPAMDDDDLRRGRATLHIHAGEAMAILAGDVMLALAFQLIAAARLSAAQRAELLAALAQGATAMIAGQVQDTLGGFSPGMTQRQRLDQIHRNKTGALLIAACRMGAICAGAAAADLEALTRYGEAIGLMFQIVDDLLDVTQPTEHLGKKSGKDVAAGKLTFPQVVGIEASRREVERLRAAARAAAATLGDRGTPLAELCDFMATRTK